MIQENLSTEFLSHIGSSLQDESIASQPTIQQHSILAVINPFSGSGRALELFKRIVAPIWEKRNVKYETFITRYAGHCIDMLKNNKTLTSYTAIIAVGGDGTLLEVIKGLKENRLFLNAEKMVSIGIIPLGSGNGLAKSLHYAVNRPYSIEEAAELTTSPISEPLDLIEISQKTQSCAGFLAVTTGLIADIDIKTEPLRFLGEFRFTLGAIMCLWNKAIYPAKLSYLPTTEEKNLQKIPDLNTPVPPQFTTIKGVFTLIMISNTSHCSSNAHTTPGAKLNDGYLHVVLLGEISRIELVSVLWGFDSGDYVNNPNVIRFTTKIIRVEPLCNEAILTLDGERLPLEPIQCSINHAAINVLCSEKMARL